MKKNKFVNAVQNLPFHCAKQKRTEKLSLFLPHSKGPYRTKKGGGRAEELHIKAQLSLEIQL